VEKVASNLATPDSAQSSVAEKRDLLARLLSRLAHEIRNPLSSLDIHVQLLEEDLSHSPTQTRQKLSGRLEIIRGELARLENIVKRFLKLASPSTLELEPVELPRVVNHVCELLRPEAASRDVQINTELEAELPVLTADGVQITQALLNLVINALQAVDRGGRIQVRVFRSPRENSIAIEVQDNGPGVPPEQLTAVFEPYFTTKEEGSGLGLWIAQQIAIAHGGTLEVSNVSEGGACFHWLLPWPKEMRANG
jgi:two-component system sensor histidine kinase HydH